jgi:hypothetical protein
VGLHLKITKAKAQQIILAWLASATHDELCSAIHHIKNTGDWKIQTAEDNEGNDDNEVDHYLKDD